MLLPPLLFLNTWALLKCPSADGKDLTWMSKTSSIWIIYNCVAHGLLEIWTDLRTLDHAIISYKNQPRKKQAAHNHSVILMLECKNVYEI